VPDSELLATATATAQKLAAKPNGALLASKRLLKQPSIGQLKEAIKSESQEFMERVSSPDAKEALSAFLEKRPPNFAKSPAHAAAE
jgi:enoyl-CoA hydratase/carnithine racemase